MGPALPSQPSWITAMGAVTSVGLDASTTCASIRAGLSRPSDLTGHESVSVLDYGLVPTTGHPVPDLAIGFSNFGRWLQLAAAAIEDLCASASLPTPQADPRFWASTAAYFVVPEIDDERFEFEPAFAESELPARFRDPLLAKVASVCTPARTAIVSDGGIGVFEVLQSISWQVEGVKRILLVATDSLVDVTALRWLEEQGRLKSDQNPVGLSPGEASVALLLEHPPTAHARAATAHAVVYSAVTDADPERSSGSGPGGIALARAATRVLDQSSLGESGTASTVSDLNGEVWRAKELSAAQQRVGAGLWDSDRMAIPATSTGDPGAAMPALQIAVAAKALERNYAEGSSVLVTSSDAGGQVGAAVVARA